MTKDYGVWVAGLLAVSVMAGCGLGGKTDAPATAPDGEVSQTAEKSRNSYPANYVDGCVFHSMNTVNQNLAAEGVRDVPPEIMAKAKEASQILCECLVEKLEERLPYEKAKAADLASGTGQAVDPEANAIMQQATEECQQERLPADFFN